MQYKGCIIILIFPVFLSVSADGACRGWSGAGCSLQCSSAAAGALLCTGQSSSTLLCHCRSPHTVVLQVVPLPVQLRLCYPLLASPGNAQVLHLCRIYATMFTEAAQSSQTASYGAQTGVQGWKLCPAGATGLQSLGAAWHWAGGAWLTCC